MAIPIGTRGWCILHEVEDEDEWSDEYPADPYEVQVVRRSDDRDMDCLENTVTVTGRDTMYEGASFGVDDRDFYATYREAWLGVARAFQRMQARAHRGMNRALDEAAKIETQDADDALEAVDSAWLPRVL